MGFYLLDNFGRCFGFGYWSGRPHVAKDGSTGRR